VLRFAEILRAGLREEGVAPERRLQPALPGAERGGAAPHQGGSDVHNPRCCKRALRHRLANRRLYQCQVGEGPLGAAGRGGEVEGVRVRVDGVLALFPPDRGRGVLQGRRQAGQVAADGRDNGRQNAECHDSAVSEVDGSGRGSRLGERV
jgi:hypothetical protein